MNELHEIMNFVKNIESIGDEIIKQPKVHRFETFDLLEHNNFNIDIRQVPVFDEIFEDLNRKKNNCIYWFNLESDECAKEINCLLDINREELNKLRRVVPPKNRNENSKTLYVGIRRGGIRQKDNLTNISGRIIQHLGYYDKGSTQGLQLVHWANQSNKTILLNVVELANIPNEYLDAIEKIVAHRLKPLCGKH